MIQIQVKMRIWNSISALADSARSIQYVGGVPEMGQLARMMSRQTPKLRSLEAGERKRVSFPTKMGPHARQIIVPGAGKYRVIFPLDPAK
jgi:hypothetical protein